MLQAHGALVHGRAQVVVPRVRPKENSGCRACCSQQGQEKAQCPLGAVVPRPPCKSYLLATVKELVAPKCSPPHAGGASLELTQALPHTMASEARPRISEVYPYPRLVF